MAYTYAAYGFAIVSDVELEGLVPTETTRADVRIIASKDVDLGKTTSDVRLVLDKTTCELIAGNVGRCVFVNSAEIRLEIGIGISPRYAALLVLGPVLALWLHRAERAVFHGSGIAFRDGCAIFLGDKGTGKSTIAAACLNQGHRLLSDDIIAIATDKDRTMKVQPSSPHIHLTSEVHKQFPLDWAETVEQPHPMFPKIIKSVGLNFRKTPQELAAVYILRRGDRCGIRRMPPIDAFQALIRFSYVSRFGDYLERTNGVFLQMKQCASLTNRVFELTSPNDVAALPSVVQAVAKQLGGPETR